MNEENTRPSLLRSRRIVQYLLIALGIAVTDASYQIFNFSTICFLYTNESSVDPSTDHRVIWSYWEQAIALGGYGLGSAISMIPIGIMCDRGFTNMIMITSLLSVAICTGFMPLLIKTSVVLVTAARILSGFTAGALTPLALTVLSFWTPEQEMSLAIGIAIAAYDIGKSGANLLGGIVCDQSPQNDGSQMLGWPLGFYILSLLNIVVFCMWVIFSKSRPEYLKSISASELHHIEHNRVLKSTGGEPTELRLQLSWRKVLSSPALIVTALSRYTGVWVVTLYSMFMPIYLSTVWSVSPLLTGGVSAITSLSLVVGRFVCGPVGHQLEKHFSLVNVAKIGNTIAVLGTASLMVPLAFLGTGEGIVAIILVSTGLFFAGFSVIGAIKSEISLAPKFTGIIAGICSAVGKLGMVTCPILFGAVTTKSSSNFDAWHMLFWITVGMSCISCIAYVVFGTTKEQDWMKRQHPQLVTEAS